VPLKTTSSELNLVFKKDIIKEGGRPRNVTDPGSGVEGDSVLKMKVVTRGGVYGDRWRGQGEGGHQTGVGGVTTR
jgi:hypothetical protein